MFYFDAEGHYLEIRRYLATDKLEIFETSRHLPEMFGYSDNELQGASLRRLLDGNSISAVEEMLEICGEDIPLWQILRKIKDFRILHRNRKAIRVKCRIVSFPAGIMDIETVRIALEEVNLTDLWAISVFEIEKLTFLSVECLYDSKVFLMLCGEFLYISSLCSLNVVVLTANIGNIECIDFWQDILDACVCEIKAIFERDFECNVGYLGGGMIGAVICDTTASSFAKLATDVHGRLSSLLRNFSLKQIPSVFYGDIVTSCITISGKKPSPNEIRSLMNNIADIGFIAYSS